MLTPIMKPTLTLFAALVLSASPFVDAVEKDSDPFEKGMRQAFSDYKKGDDAAVTEQLRELLKMLEERGAEKVGEILPREVGEWRGELVKREDLSVVGGGISISRVYSSGNKSIMVKVMKDSPLVKQLLPLILNEELVRMSNRKTYRISGETAIMDGEDKLQMVVDDRIFVELSVNSEAHEKDLVALVRKLDLNALAKIK